MHAVFAKIRSIKITKGGKNPPPLIFTKNVLSGNKEKSSTW